MRRRRNRSHSRGHVGLNVQSPLHTRPSAPLPPTTCAICAPRERVVLDSTAASFGRYAFQFAKGTDSQDGAPGNSAGTATVLNEHVKTWGQLWEAEVADEAHVGRRPVGAISFLKGLSAGGFR